MELSVCLSLTLIHAAIPYISMWFINNTPSIYKHIEHFAMRLQAQQIFPLISTIAYQLLINTWAIPFESTKHRFLGSGFAVHYLTRPNSLKSLRYCILN